MELLLGCIGFIVLMIALLFYGPLSWGFVLYKFWYWFLIPTFPEIIPEITYLNAVALWLMTNFFKYMNLNDVKNDDENKYLKLFAVLILPWVTLGSGWLLKYFIF